MSKNLLGQKRSNTIIPNSGTRSNVSAKRPLDTLWRKFAIEVKQNPKAFNNVYRYAGSK